jgi:hypothetical protein
MTANELIAAIAERFNLKGLELNEQRLAAIAIGDMCINFEEDEEAEWFYVHGEVMANASSLPKEKLLSLLKANHLFNDLPNATFGISRDDALELFLRVQIAEGLMEDDWIAMFLSFLSSLKEWRVKLGTDEDDGSSEVDEPSGLEAGLSSGAKEEEENPFGFSGGIRV